jgi:signal transduction histidine kinase
VGAPAADTNAMRSEAPGGNPAGRIVVRFALTSFIVLVLVGVAITQFRTRDLGAREERSAASRAELLATQVIGPAFTPEMTTHPLVGTEYARIDSVVKQAIAADPGVERVKIWGIDGTVLFSDDAAQVGQRPDKEDDLQEAIDGEVKSDISDLTKPENASERLLADKLFETYVPVRLSAGGPVAAVVEVYRNYSTIQGEIDRLTKTLTVSLGIGLLALYVLLLPVMVGATRTLRRQNEQLHAQADQLGDLLEREQATVAELRELDRMKGDFVAASSHELRSPLTSILGYARILRESTASAGDPVTHEAVDAIERQSSRMLRLVTNLLRESRIEADVADGGTATFDVGALIREVVTDFHGDGMRIRPNIPDDLQPVNADRGRIAEVLINLVDNSLKYSGNDSVVTVAAEVEDGELILRVHDEGPGIDPDDLPLIFDRFYQADQSATRLHGGVGLGLHIVKGLVESMHGRVAAESLPGVGSTFTVLIPLVKQPERVAAPSAHV